MKTTAALAFLSLALSCASATYADTFGSGLDIFDIEFVTIGNPGNPADTTGDPNPAGKVDYAYRMGKYEISEQMIEKASALGGFGIAHSSRGSDKAVTNVSWTNAAKFVSWLNTSKGFTPAYKFNDNGFFRLWEPGDAGYNPNNLFRNSLAHYFLPSADEWYKAAYYDPTNDVYFDYPTGSDSLPTPVASGMAAGTAVYDQPMYDPFPPLSPDPTDITLAGGPSPYGTVGQGGNVSEWEETESDFVNDNLLLNRTFRGGGWRSPSTRLLASSRITGAFAFQAYEFNGFRVASIAIPEPSSLLLLCVGTIGLAALRRWLAGAECP